MSVISLITDFGTSDEYVGVMKGTILSVNPETRIVDISHHVPPQDILQAAFLIHSSYKFFPVGTVHLIVVDPGVGTNRSIVALKKNDFYFVAPDNGILSYILEEGGQGNAVSVTNAAYFLKNISCTFHGRDIMAPIAAHISRGLDLALLGSPLDTDSLVKVDIKKAVVTKPGEISGSIISVDAFGNLTTNIHLTTLFSIMEKRKFGEAIINIGNNKIRGISNSYSDADSKMPLCIIGSRGYLEVAVNCGNALDFFTVKRQDPVKVILPDIPRIK